MEHIRVMISENILSSTIQRLIKRSAWFEVTPLPDGQWEIITKPENSKAFVEQSSTPPDPQHGREPDEVKPKTGIIYDNCDGCKNEVCPHRMNKPKPLAQYLGEYLATGIDRTHEAGMPMDFTEEGLKPIFEQALDAYESTEQVKIRIERI